MKFGIAAQGGDWLPQKFDAAKCDVLDAGHTILKIVHI